MSELRKHFMIGFREGWEAFWSPFTGLWAALSKPWREILHVSSKKRHVA